MIKKVLVHEAFFTAIRNIPDIKLLITDMDFTYKEKEVKEEYDKEVRFAIDTKGVVYGIDYPESYDKDTLSYSLFSLTPDNILAIYQARNAINLNHKMFDEITIRNYTKIVRDSALVPDQSITIATETGLYFRDYYERNNVKNFQETFGFSYDYLNVSLERLENNEAVPLYDKSVQFIMHELSLNADYIPGKMSCTRKTDDMNLDYERQRLLSLVDEQESEFCMGL